MILVLLIFSFVSPILAIPFTLMYFQQSKSVKWCSVLIGISMSALIYGYVADQGNDIYRHILNLRLYEGKTFFQAFDAGPLNAVYIWDIWQWIISKCHNDYLLQSSGAFVGYTLLSYMIFDYANERGLTTKSWLTAICIMLLTSSPLGFSIGIRSSNAFAICSYALYIYFYKNKSYFVTLFIIAMSVFLHHGVIIILALWAIYPIIKKKPMWGVLGLLIVLLTYTSYEDYIAVFMSGGSILESMGLDISKSVNAYTMIRSQSFHYIFVTLLQAIFVLLLFIRGDGLSQIRNLRQMRSDERNISVFILQMMVTTFSFLFLLTSNGGRYFAIVQSLVMYSFMDAIEKDSFIRGRKKLWQDVPLLLTIVSTFLLILYDMNWGTGDIGSLGFGLITGFFSRSI